MSNIVSSVNELKSINTEIKRLTKETSVLRKRAKAIEENILDFLAQKDQPGVKFKDTAIVVETKPKWTYKGKKDKEEDSLRILEEYGVSNSRTVLDELRKASKGDELQSRKLKFKTIKSSS
jgi:hypothetical protein